MLYGIQKDQKENKDGLRQVAQVGTMRRYTVKNAW
jgi:hypothetical protein